MNYSMKTVHIYLLTAIINFHTTAIHHTTIKFMHSSSSHILHRVLKRKKIIIKISKIKQYTHKHCVYILHIQFLIFIHKFLFLLPIHFHVVRKKNEEEEVGEGEEKKKEKKNHTTETMTTTKFIRFLSIYGIWYIILYSIIYGSN